MNHRFITLHDYFKYKEPYGLLKGFFLQKTTAYKKHPNNSVLN